MTRALTLATKAHSRRKSSWATLVLSLDSIFSRWQLSRPVVLGKNDRYVSVVAPVVDHDYASLLGPYADSVVPHPRSLGSSAVGFSGPRENRYRNHRQSHRECLWPR